MKHLYSCLDCIESDTGKPVSDLTAQEYKVACGSHIFRSYDKCPECGGSKIVKVYGLEACYIRGYGYADKAGMKRDSDLHLMINNADPYGSHRKPGESREVIGKLQKSREIKKHPVTIKLKS